VDVHVLRAPLSIRSLAALVGPNGRVAGVDISETMVAQARIRTEGLAVECYVGDAYRLHFESGTFDASRADRVFQHLERPRRICDTARVGSGVSSRPSLASAALW
jgi:ubiquinone/menaquinone biosynthesis C-methylase UbiE